MAWYELIPHGTFRRLAWDERCGSVLFLKSLLVTLITVARWLESSTDINSVLRVAWCHLPCVRSGLTRQCHVHNTALHVQHGAMRTALDALVPGAVQYGRCRQGA